MPEAQKRCPFRADPPRTGHYRQSPPPPGHRLRLVALRNRSKCGNVLVPEDHIFAAYDFSSGQPSFPFSILLVLAS